jgi:hypothetical protein
MASLRRGHQADVAIQMNSFLLALRALDRHAALAMTKET